jgi:rhodanese-related sulfurtransferase
LAAGDCCECLNFVTGKKHSYNLATIANIQGRTAGYNATGGRDMFTDSIPTSIIKVLDLAIGKTGIGFREAKSSELDVAKIEIHFLNHAGYYPGAKMMHMMAVYNTDTGDILGFQAIGFEDVDKKIDVMSTAIRAKMKIWDLVDLDLGYHPQYGSAKDPLNILGMIGENIKKGEVTFMDVEELKDLMERGEDIEIIDVRTVKEYRAGHIEGAVNIPLDELRENIKSLDKDSRIVVHCRSSYRSYLAYRILKNAGFKNVWNLNGSYLSWIRKI